ncbi:MAG: hypothetical protein M3083_18415 [Actinomycetota bacterium]|nr:hypothetical protein [Actinomycetota bacterium]
MRDRAGGPWGRPDPSDEEMAAIMAAREVSWPGPPLESPRPADAPNRWRFSGRWWARPAPARREGKTWRWS